MELRRGDVAVVTGAASGIGLGVVERFCDAGLRVVLADIEAPLLREQTERLASQGADVRAVVVDVSDATSVAALADATVDAFGAVHVVCNNAGVCHVAPTAETDLAVWRWLVDVNLFGVVHGITTFTPLLVAQGRGHIVNTASEMGLVGMAGLGAYAATKHAVVGLSETLRFELEGTGVGVSCLCPNAVRTRIWRSERNRPFTPELTPVEQARVAPFLRGGEGNGIPGHDVGVLVHEAVLEDRFWVFTHDVTRTHAARRGEDATLGRNPVPPYASPTEG